MPTLQELISGAYGAIDSYYAQNHHGVNGGHGYRLTEEAKTHVRDYLTKLPEPELATLNIDSVNQAAQLHYENIGHTYRAAGGRPVSLGHNMQTLRQNVHLDVPAAIETTNLRRPTIPGDHVAIGRFSDVLDPAKQNIFKPSGGGRVFGKHTDTTIDLTKLNPAERERLVGYMQHHPDAAISGAVTGITPASKRIVVKGHLPAGLTTALESHPVGLMYQSTHGTVKLDPTKIVKPPFIPKVTAINEFNFESFLAGHRATMAAPGALPAGAGTHLELAHVQLEDALRNHFATGGGPLDHNHVQGLLHEHTAVIHGAERGAVKFGNNDDIRKHLEGRLNGTRPSVLDGVASQQRLLLQGELDKLLPSKITDAVAKKGHIQALVENQIKNGVIIRPEKMPEVVAHLAQQDLAHLENMTTHMQPGRQAALQNRLAKRAIIGTPGEDARRMLIAHDETARIKGLQAAGDTAGLDLARATHGHEQFERVLDFDAKAPLPEAPKPADLAKPAKKTWLGRSPDEKLYKAGTAMETANAEMEAARIAQQKEIRAAQERAAQIEQLKQKAKNADAAVKTAATAGDPAAIRTAQLEAAKAQQELLALKDTHTTHAKLIAEKTQAYSTYSHNAAVAEHEFKTLQHKLAPDAHPHPGDAPKPVGAAQAGDAEKGIIRRTTNQRVEDSHRALDARKADIHDAQAKVVKSERAATSIDVGGPDTKIGKATTKLNDAISDHGKATQHLDDLKGQRQALIDRSRTGSTADRIAATSKLAEHEKQVAAAVEAEKQAKKAYDAAKAAHTKAMKPVAAATAAHDAAHQATTNGKYTNTPTSENRVIKQAAADKLAAAEQKAAAKLARAEQRALEKAARQAARASKPPGLLSRLWNDNHSGLGGIARTEQAAINNVVHQAEHQAPGMLQKAAKGALTHGGNAVGAVAKTAHGFVGNAMKVALIGGAGIAALSLLPSLMGSSGASAAAARRLSLNDDLNNDLTSPPMTFNPNADVGVGAVAMPQVGQAQQMGNWVSRMPTLDQTLAMGGNPLPPVR